MKLVRTLWLTADRDEVVEDGDARAAFLLGTAGKEIPDAEAERLGLKPSRKSAAEEKKADAPEDKKAPPPANKSRTAKATKTTKK